MRSSFLILFVMMSLCGFSKDYSLRGKISGLDRQIVYLASMYGERSTKVDSVTSDSSGRFNFTIKENLPPGMYRVISGKDILIEIILNKEDVEFKTSAFAVGDSLSFTRSLENKIYYKYMKLDRKSQEKLQLLTPVLDFYPEVDDFYKRTASEFETIQKNLAFVLDTLKNQYPDLYAIRIFRMQQTPFLSSTLLKEARIAYLKNHYLDNVNFNDTLLLHSNAWSNKAISYLSLYSNSGYPQEQLEAEFIKGVTIILKASEVNPNVFKFLLDYYVGGFDKYHFDEVISYMAENFQDPFACEDQERKTVLQKKLDNFKKISVGKIAPAIEISSKDGKPITLSAIKSDYTLVIFWSSECSHCVEMMPKIKEFYDRQKPRKVEILAISLDTDKKSWTDFISEGKFKWLDVSELKGFGSKSADDYNVYASPTMFLLDKDKKILARPVSYRELQTSLNELGLN